MKSSDFRNYAREKLKGKWGKVAKITLSYLFISIIFAIIGAWIPGTLQSIWSIAICIFELPLSFGLLISLYKIYTDNDSQPFDFFSFGFDNFAKIWVAYFHRLLRILLPLILTGLSVLLIVFGMVAASVSAVLYFHSAVNKSIIPFLIVALIGVILYAIFMIWLITKSYYYSLSYIILADNPEITSKDAVLLSEKLMKGNRGKLFSLQISFIGWSLLAILSLGIGFIWLIPYMQFAQFSFYDSLVETEQLNSHSQENQKK